MRTPFVHHGSVLIIVLWVTFGLVSMALYFANTMSLELRASDNYAAGIVSGLAIEGAARYVNNVLVTCATNGVMPDASRYQAAAVPVGEARFWMIGRDNDSVPVNPARLVFGLVDEASKLNLNTVTTNMLDGLPCMTSELNAAILDWRGTNGNGGSQMVYAMQSQPYQCKNAPFETVDELRLLSGAGMEILAGGDVNRNGVLDPNEKRSDGNSRVSPGLFEYMTVYSREPNMHSDGSLRTNVNNLAQLGSLLKMRFAAARAGEILNRLGFRQTQGKTSPSPPTFRGLLPFYIRSGMTAEEFGRISNEVTASTAAYTRGRVNINTASSTVLACLPGMDPGTAQQAVSYRRSNPDKVNSIAWIVDALGVSSPAIQALQAGDYITTQTYQFTADIAAVGPYGRGYRRVKYVFDISGGMPRIVYRQDLSRLGWALGDDVRQTWVVRSTL